MSKRKIFWCNECHKEEYKSEIARLKEKIASLTPELETARQDNLELVRQYNELVKKVEGKHGQANNNR